MDALERLAKLLAQQHSLQSAAAASSGAAPAVGSLFEAASAAAAYSSGHGRSRHATAEGQQQQLQLPQLHLDHLYSGAGAQQQPPPPPAGSMGAASAGDLQAALAHLLKSHQHLVQQTPVQEQAGALSLAQPPQQAEGLALDGSRGSSADVATAAAAAVPPAAAGAAAPAGDGGEGAAGRRRQVELARSVAQLVGGTLQLHPDCLHLRQMGAAISEVLLRFVAPGSVVAQAQAAPAHPQPPGLQGSEHHHALLAALLQPPAASPAGASPTLRAFDAAPGGGGSGPDVLLAAALQERLRQHAWQDAPAGHQPGQLFRPQPMRALSGHQTAGTDPGTATRWPQLLQSVQQGGGGSQQSNASSPANKRQRTDQGFEVAHNPGAPAWAGALEQTGLAAVAGGSQQGATPPSLVPLLQGPNPRSPAAATAAAAAAAAAAALRPLAAREQAIPRQVPATLRRDLLQQSLQHPLAAVDRLLTNATYMNRLHVNQSMAHDLLPDVDDIQLPKEQQRQGSGGSLLLFKHSIVVVDEQDRAWPVQYEGFMSAGQRHLRLGAGWRYLCRANVASVGDTLVLERWTQDRSVLHLRIVRAAQLLPPLPGMPAPLPAGGPADDIPPQLQAMLGAAEAAAELARGEQASVLPPMPEQVLPDLPLPQQQAQQQAAQKDGLLGGGSGSPLAGSLSIRSGRSDTPSDTLGVATAAAPAMPEPQSGGGAM